MASYLDKVQVNTAISDNTKLDLGHQSITTSDFMQMSVATIHELVPGSKLDVNMESFARLNPLPVPTFGRAAMRNRAFFVPFRTLFRGWNDFITDSPHVASNGYSAGAVGSLIPNVPTVGVDALRDVFLEDVGADSTHGMIYEVTPNQSNSNWDITWTVNTVTKFYCYTVLGRQSIKLLEQLGYKLDWVSSKDVKLSALPLLALAKIYVDWYYPQQYSNRTEYDLLLSLCNHDVAAGPLDLTWQYVHSILSLCGWVQYDSDLFVSSWDSPNQPNPGNLSSDFKLVNIDSIGQVFGSTLYNISSQNGVSNNAGSAINSGDSVDRYGGLSAPFITGYVNGGPNNTPVTGGVSEYLLHCLHALTDYMKRHQLAGSRAFDRYLARFGKALPAEKMNRCLYLGASMQDIQIGDVVSTADTIATAGTRGSQLGAFAGKGISYGNGHFSCDTDEFGYFIILSTIVPATGYFQGIDPICQRLTKLDFWTPEFDSLGVEPLKACTLFMPQIAGLMSNGDPYDQVFGFVPRYATYKAPTVCERLTGNFRLPSLNAGIFQNSSSAWHLMRDFSAFDFQQDWSNVVHSPQFISGGSDFSQYKRIFYADFPDSPDNFTVIHNFEIAEYAPMKALYDTYEFEDKGKKVTLETNGVKMN
jgi:hypothetical protein